MIKCRECGRPVSKKALFLYYGSGGKAVYLCKRRECYDKYNGGK